MVDENDGSEKESRPPTLDDLIHICGELNKRGARYVVIGGLAMLQLGFARATEDIDLLVDASKENQEKVRAALRELPDRAIDQMEDTDLDEYLVVRIADEIVIDLMKEACGVRFADAKDEIVEVDIEGTRIPFANETLMLKLKKGVREKDTLDRNFLLARQGAK